MKHIIIITGEAESGKDTVAAFIKSYFYEQGKRVLLTHYADMLKYSCINYFDWDGRKDETGRSILQYVGETIRKKYDEDFWVDYLWTMLDMSSDNWDVAIIPDARHENEINVGIRTIVMDSKPKVDTIKIVRKNHENSLTDEQRNDSSETDVEKLKTGYIIINDGTLDDLKEKATKVAEKIDGREVKKPRRIYPGDIVKVYDRVDEQYIYAIVLECIAINDGETVWGISIDGHMKVMSSKDATVVGTVSEEFNDMLFAAKMKCNK